MGAYVVYAHKNKVNGKKYIGMTNNPERRWRSKGIEYKPKSYEKQNRPFWNAIEKYGWKNFEQKILAEKLTFEEACELEKKYIQEYETTPHANGYNVALGGEGGLVYQEHPRGMKGKRQTKYQIKKQTKMMSDRNKNPMTNGSVKWGVTHEHPKGMLGKSHSEEFKKHLSENYSRANHGSARPVTATLPEGEELEFGCLNDCLDHFGIRYSLGARVMKSGEPYKLSKYSGNASESTRKFVGTSLRWSDNTEITG